MIGRILSGAFLFRFLLAALLVFGIYNTTGVSYYHWYTQANAIEIPMIIVGVITIGFFAFFVVAWWHSPAKLIFIFFPLVLSLGIWWMSDMGLINLNDPTVAVVVTQVMIAFVLALGSLWSKIWRGTTSQQTVLDGDSGSQ